MPLRPTDVFVSGYPRSGTTWIQELVWMIANDLDYSTSGTVTLLERFPSLEYSMYMHPLIEENLELLISLIQPGIQKLADLPSPRFIKTHVPLSLLPPTLLHTAKMVYVARDPRDVVVSYYHHSIMSRTHCYAGDFKTYWNCFLKNLVLWSPYFKHLNEAWEQRNNPNMLFLFYEELSKDLPSAVRRVANFFDKQLTEEQISRLCDHLSFDKFKKSNRDSYESIKKLFFFTSGEDPFIRKGKVGGWRDYFDEDMRSQAERWMADNLRDTDLRFSHFEIQ